jgi:hypothetical protein
VRVSNEVGFQRFIFSERCLGWVGAAGGSRGLEERFELFHDFGMNFRHVVRFADVDVEQ